MRTRTIGRTGDAPIGAGHRADRGVVVDDALEREPSTQNDDRLTHQADLDLVAARVEIQGAADRVNHP